MGSAQGEFSPPVRILAVVHCILCRRIRSRLRPCFPSDHLSPNKSKAASVRAGAACGRADTSYRYQFSIVVNVQYVFWTLMTHPICCSKCRLNRGRRRIRRTRGSSLPLLRRASSSDGQSSLIRRRNWKRSRAPAFSKGGCLPRRNQQTSNSRAESSKHSSGSAPAGRSARRASRPTRFR